MIIFLADDLGWADVGYHGSEIRTPSIDRLVEEGVELDRFYVLQVCSPTRAALLTGRHPMRYGLSSGVVQPWSPEGVSLKERLLPEMLKEAGYATHIVGKWHLGSTTPEQLPTRRGFDHHYGQYLGMIDYYTREREGGLDWHRDRTPLREEGHSTHLIRDEAVRVVENHDPAVPLFLYVPFSAPHYPLQAPEEDVAAYSNIDNAERRVYAAMVTGMDQAIGAVLTAVEERGLRERTLVLFLSDNGGFPARQGSNVPLRGGKGGLHEGGLRVSAVLSWPGVLPEGRKISARLHAVDLCPTLLRLAGLSLEREPALDGVDLWPCLVDDTPLQRDVLLLNVEPHRGALLAGDRKLLVDFTARGQGDPLAGVELYDLSTDPNETTNLAEEQKARSLELVQVLHAYHEAMVARPEDRERQLSEDYPIPEVWGPGR